MRIEAVREATPAVLESLTRLLPQLNPQLAPPDMHHLRRLLADPAVTLLFATEGGEVIGTTTVAVYTTSIWIKARLDEVVVDSSARGRGVGEALVNAALDVARERGAQIAELQSARRPDRAAAHRLYSRMGFKIRDSDLFRLELQ